MFNLKNKIKKIIWPDIKSQQPQQSQEAQQFQEAQEAKSISTKHIIRDNFLQRCNYQHFPYPHLVVDNLIDRSILDELEKYWPSHELFFESGIVGEYSLVLDEKLPHMPLEMQVFWRDFKRDVMSEIMQSTYSVFESFFIKKYGSVPKVVCPIVLMEIENTYCGHEIHTHHYHDPLWLFTNLLYVRKLDENVPGTSLFGINDSVQLCAHEQAIYAAKTLQWDDLDEIQLKKTVDFVEGRLFSFIDSPISYHGVITNNKNENASVPKTAKIARRIVKSHVRFESPIPENVYKDLYGVNPSVYALERRRSSKRPYVINWLQKEIETIIDVIHGESERSIVNEKFSPIYPTEFYI